MELIDAHVHLGDGPHKRYTLQSLQNDLEDAGACGAIIFAFPEDIYRVSCSRDSRKAANEYVLQAARNDDSMIPFYFIFNDYTIPDNFAEFVGIKWHRHPDEPRYDYSLPACDAALERIRHRNMPVIFEEEFENTVRFVDDNPQLSIIIPHCGMLNGGTRRMARFFDNTNIYFDTSVASLDDLAFIAENVPAERIIFGSDVSGTSEPFFNFPAVELRKVQKLKLRREQMALIYSENIKRLVGQVDC